MSNPEQPHDDFETQMQAEEYYPDPEDDLDTDDEFFDDEGDQFMYDGEADADALASAGWGTEEDYGGDNEGVW